MTTTQSKPILFSGPLVRAIMEGRKTQTRRVVKNQGEGTVRAEVVGPWVHLYDESVPVPGTTNRAGKMWTTKCPYGANGDRLWVRENGWQRPVRTEQMMRQGADTWERYYYDADGIDAEEAAELKAFGFKRRPSIHMPRWASRLTLEVTGVRVERVQEISEEDAKAEGIAYTGLVKPGTSTTLRETYGVGDEGHAPTARSAFMDLWDEINCPRGFGWESNPFVWVVEFRVIPQGEVSA